MKSSNFALIGVAGYIAPRHIKAIKNNNCTLDSCMDISDSVGIIDKYFDDCKFFPDFERFERYLSKIQSEGSKIDYISICSPNHLHDTHIRFALNNNCNVICEKPIVLYPHNLEAIQKMVNKTKKEVFTILQLRYHPNVKKILKEIQKEKKKKYEVELTYITFRGAWYDYSWKGDKLKSGGITTNIGVHFFDLLHYIFGNCKENIVHLNDVHRASGYLELEKANVRWYLSTDKFDLPKKLNKTQKSYRSLTIDGKEFDLSYGFDDLHDICYKEILSGRGFTLKDVWETINIVSKIRSVKPDLGEGFKHTMLKCL